MLKKIFFKFCYTVQSLNTFKLLAYKIDPMKFLKKEGATIGLNCRWMSSFICSEPYLLSIGNHVSIGYGVQLITHEGATWVLRELEQNDALEKFAPIIIGNNVFLGNNSIIFPGVKIGDNVIVGTGSLVTKSIPENSVVVGSPARVLKSIDEFSNDTLKQCISSRGLNEMERIDFILEHLKAQQGQSTNEK